MAENYPLDSDVRPHDGLTELWRGVGRVRVRLTCPFCNADVEAYLWSLAGSGKKCTCGAVCGQWGAWKRRPRKAT